MRKKVTIKDIANAMNTAYSTVSRALNNLPGVSEDMRKKILAMAHDMGYEPNLIAQHLRKGYGCTIGLIVPRINRFFFAEVIHGVETIAKQKGFNVLIAQSNDLLIDESDCIKTLIAQNVAGIIVSASVQTFSSKSFDEVLLKKIPIVMFDRTFNSMEVSKVKNDNYLGAFQAVEHLIKNGYSNIIHFAGPKGISIYDERCEGYKAALSAHGLPINPSHIIENVITREKGYQTVLQLIEKQIKFDAVFGAGDYSALGALLCLQENGYKVPDDFGVVGVANEPFTELIGMTSLEQFSEEMGRSAANLLFEDIERNGQQCTPREMVYKPQLICRNSSQRIKNTN